MSKTLQGHRTKLNETTKKQTQNDRSADSQYSRADNSYTVQYNHDRLVIVKRRPENYSFQLATERRQRRCIPGGRRQAVPRTCRSYWDGTITEC